MENSTDNIPEEENEEQLDDGLEHYDYVPLPTDSEYINAATGALSIMEQYNPMTKEGRMLKARVTRKSLRIIDHCIGTMYAEIFLDENGS